MAETEQKPHNSNTSLRVIAVMNLCLFVITYKTVFMFEQRQYAL